MEVIHLPVQQEAPTPSLQDVAPIGPLEFHPGSIANNRSLISSHLAGILMATPPKHWHPIIEQFDNGIINAVAERLKNTHLGFLAQLVAASYDAEALHPAAAPHLVILDWINIAAVAAEFTASSTSDQRRQTILCGLKRQQLQLLRHEVGQDKRCRYCWLQSIDTHIDIAPQ